MDVLIAGMMRMLVGTIAVCGSGLYRGFALSSVFASRLVGLARKTASDFAVVVLCEQLAAHRIPHHQTAKPSHRPGMQREVET